MRVEALQFDVVIAGSDSAAFTAAILYARSGVRVGLVNLPTSTAIEFSRTAIIRPTARVFLNKLGLDHQDDITPGSQVEIWTQWGWIADHLFHDSPGNVLVNQSRLIQQLADLSAQTNDLTMIPATSLEDVVTVNGKVIGLQIQRKRDSQPLRVLGRLTVAANDAAAQIAALAKLGTADQAAHPVRYHACYLFAPIPKVQVWLLNPNMVVAIPHDDGETEVICVPAPENCAAFASNPERSFSRLVASLPDSGALRSAQRTSSVLSPAAIADVTRSDRLPGLTFIDHTRMTTDPLWGTNLALQAVEALVNHTVYPLMVSGELEAGLHLYRRWHQETHRNQHDLADLTIGRSLNRRGKLLLAAAARDESLAHHVQASITGLTDDLFAPDVLARATWTNMTYRQPGSVPIPQS